MKKTIVAIFAVCTMSLGLVSCQALQDFFGESTVFTTADQLEEGEVGVEVPFDQLPDEVKSRIPEGTTVVMADEAQLKEDAAYISVAGPTTGDAFFGLVQSALGVGKLFVPGIAAWEGILLALSRRKRKHWGRAVQSVNPLAHGDKTIDVGSALKSITAAIGATHSSEGSAETFEAEIAEEEEA